MYLGLSAEVFVLGAVAVPQSLPFFVEEDLFVTQQTTATTQQIPKHYQKLRLLVGLVQNLCEFLTYRLVTLSGMNI